MMSEKTVDMLTKFLLRDIVIFNEKKQFKQGKLKLFHTKEFYYILTLEMPDGGMKDYEIPYPFDIVDYGDHLKLDYTLEQFAQEKDDVFFKSKIINTKRRSKLFNTVVVLSAY